MNLKSNLIILLLSVAALATGQEANSLNQTDAKGRKQGHWIKKYPDESVLYEGYFKDDHPVGEFKRYYENKVLKSVLTFSPNGKEATAILYHPNGNIASKGRYINQKKEGKWLFYSAFTKNSLIAEETFSLDLREGLTVKYYSDSTVAEKINYVRDVKQGEWIKYYPNGSILLKSQYNNGLIEGKFESWFDSGKPEFTGQYKNDARDGLWIIYNEDGSVKYRLNYEDGITKDHQLDIDQSKILDEREKNKDQIEDPEKSGSPKKP